MVLYFDWFRTSAMMKFAYLSVPMRGGHGGYLYTGTKKVGKKWLQKWMRDQGNILVAKRGGRIRMQGMG